MMPMRRLVLALALTTLTARFSRCDTTTPRAGITVPSIGSTGWGTTINANWNTIDANMCVQAAANTFTQQQTFNQAILMNAQAQIRFYDATSHYIGIQSPATVTTTNFNLPTGDGAPGQFIKTDGSGNLSFGPGSSSVAPTIAVNQSGVQKSSPTTDFNFLGPPFKVTLVTGSTAQIAIDPSSGTLQGNIFNGANQLVKLDASSKLPVVDGSQLTNLIISGQLPAGDTHYWQNPSSGTFPNNFGITGTTITATSVTATSVTVSNLSSGLCVQTGANGILTTAGGVPCLTGTPIYSQNTLQTGTTFYVSSGSVSGAFNANSLKADGDNLYFGNISNTRFWQFQNLDNTTANACTIGGIVIGGCSNSRPVMKFMPAGTVEAYMDGSGKLSLGGIGPNQLNVIGAAFIGSTQLYPSAGTALFQVQADTASYTYQMAVGPTRDNYDFSISSMGLVAVSSLTVSGATSFSSQTKAQLQGTIPSRVGQTYFCSDCTTAVLCVSSGTSVNAFYSSTNRSVGCQ